MTTIALLNDYMNHYIQGTLEKKKFESIVYKCILDNYHYFHLDSDEEERIDYLCWLYPRLSRAIDSYRDIGSSFDSYLNSVIYWSLREYRFIQAKNNLTEYAYWTARAEDMVVSENNDCLLSYEEEDKKAVKHFRNPRQILFLLLKSYCFVSEDFLRCAAKSLNMTEKELQGLFLTIKNMREKNEKKIYILKEKIYSQFYHCINYEKQIKAVSPNSVCYKELSERLKRSKERIKKMREKLNKINQGATNSQIAEVLGIPKGTVDSTLYALKHRHKSGT